MRLIDLTLLQNLIGASKLIQTDPNLVQQDMPILQTHMAALQSALASRMTACTLGQSQQASPDKQEPEWLTVVEAAEKLRVSRGYLLKLIRSGKFPASPLGKRQYRIRKSDFLNWSFEDSKRKPSRRVLYKAQFSQESYQSNHKSAEDYESRIRGPRQHQSVN
jgi:excisionase family DNA binding protein